MSYLIRLKFSCSYAIDMGKPFLSRHFLGEQASCLATVPFPAAGAAEDGVQLQHNLLAMGTWSEDAQVQTFRSRHHLASG